MTGPPYHELVFSGHRPASGFELEDMVTELAYQLPDDDDGAGAMHAGSAAAIPLDDEATSADEV